MTEPLFTAVSCLICDKQMERVDRAEWAEMQPSGGVICRTSGNFGSRVLDGQTISFLVCDECLTERRERIRLTKIIKKRDEVFYEDFADRAVVA